MVTTLVDILVDEVSDLEFSAWREWELLEVSENLVIELVVPDIREIPHIWIKGLLDDSSGLAACIHGENPEVTRIGYLLAEGTISSEFRETHDVRRFIEVVSGYHDEFSSYFSHEREDGCSSSWLLYLIDVVDGFPEDAITKILSEHLFFVLYDDIDRIKVLHDRLDIMFYEGFSADFEERLGGGISEWAHTGALSRSHDDEIHSTNRIIGENGMDLRGFVKGFQKIIPD